MSLVGTQPIEQLELLICLTTLGLQTIEGINDAYDDGCMSRRLYACQDACEEVSLTVHKRGRLVACEKGCSIRSCPNLHFAGWCDGCGRFWAR